MKNNFCQYNKPIFTSLSPNTQKDDIILALKLIFQPWKWKKVEPVLILEKKFREYLNIKHAFAFNSGRSAFTAILNALEMDAFAEATVGKEILLQAFTCNATVNPIIKTGLKPVFVDIDKETLNIDIFDLEKKISDQSKIVLVQHTFGMPANMDRVMGICQKHNLILIEDCAHSLGATYNEKKLGTFGTAAFFSFGRDKVISSVFGGMATTNDEDLARKIGEYRDKLAKPSCFWTFQQLLHPILNNLLVIPLYGFFGTGKWFLIFLQKIGLLSKAVKNEEKQGKMSDNSAKKMPNKLALLALNQFNKLEKVLKNQKEIASFYQENLKNPDFILPNQDPKRIYMRYSLLLKDKDTDKILKKARKQKIFLDDGWRKTVIVPPDTNQEKMGYRAGDCPVAEKVAENILNLPTHINISKEEAKRITDFLNKDGN